MSFGQNQNQNKNKMNSVNISMVNKFLPHIQSQPQPLTQSWDMQSSHHLHNGIHTTLPSISSTQPSSSNSSSSTSSLTNHLNSTTSVPPLIRTNMPYPLNQPNIQNFSLLQSQSQNQLQNLTTTTASSSSSINPQMTDGKNKPDYSYASLIAQAITGSPNKCATLSDIYVWISQHYPFYQMEDTSWQGSVRYNLSYNKCFVKAGQLGGKGSLWTFKPLPNEVFEKGHLKKKRGKFAVMKSVATGYPNGPKPTDSREEIKQMPLEKNSLSEKIKDFIEKQPRKEASTIEVFNFLYPQNFSTNEDMRASRIQNIKDILDTSGCFVKSGVENYSVKEAKKENKKVRYKDRPKYMEDFEKKFQNTPNKKKNSKDNESPSYLQDPRAKPPYSYGYMIGQALIQSKEGRMTLSQIIEWVMETYPYYRFNKSPWQNLVRQNLSMKACFRKVEKEPEGGRGSLWEIRPEMKYVFMDGTSFKGGKLQGLFRKDQEHLNSKGSEERSEEDFNSNLKEYSFEDEEDESKRNDLKRKRNEKNIKETEEEDDEEDEEDEDEEVHQQSSSQMHQQPLHHQLQLHLQQQQQQHHHHHHHQQHLQQQHQNHQQHQQQQQLNPFHLNSGHPLNHVHSLSNPLHNLQQSLPTQNFSMDTRGKMNPPFNPTYYPSISYHPVLSHPQASLTFPIRPNENEAQEFNEMPFEMGTNVASIDYNISRY